MKHSCFILILIEHLKHLRFLITKAIQYLLHTIILYKRQLHLCTFLNPQTTKRSQVASFQYMHMTAFAFLFRRLTHLITAPYDNIAVLKHFHVREHPILTPRKFNAVQRVTYHHHILPIFTLIIHQHIQTIHN